MCCLSCLAACWLSVCCLLHVGCCVLCVVCFMLLIAGICYSLLIGWLVVVRCQLLVDVVRCSWFVVCCVLYVGFSSLLLGVDSYGCLWFVAC